MNLKAWLGAFRLRTLPLALSTVILGSLVAASKQVFNFQAFYWAIITTILLQILSNLANDLGDSLKGTDNEARIGPMRAVQSGAISITKMKWAVAISSILCLLAGLQLLFVSFNEVNLKWLLFFALGIAAIAAAINYTLGKRAYGYFGLGDLFVFLFFGLLGVFGTFFLHALRLEWDVFLPAISIGVFSAAVLNMNNMRDIENDRNNHKRTLVVFLGFEKAKYYHFALLIIGFVTAFVFILLNWSSPMQFLGLISLPIFASNFRVVMKNSEPKLLNSELKKLALGTLFFSLSFGLSIMLF